MNSRPQQFLQLHSEHNATLINYISGQIRCRAEAYDIAQEAYIRLYAVEGTATIAHPRAMLFRIAKNLVIDWCRKRDVRQAYVEQEPLRADNEYPSLERALLAIEELEATQRAIETLPPRTQMALRLIREDGLSYEELAQRLGIKTHSTRRLIERAMEFLTEQTA